MWYALNCDEGLIAEGKTKKEVLEKISDMDTRCRRMGQGEYVYEQKDESERGFWLEIAYIFGSKELACQNGFNWAFEMEDESNGEKD